MNAPFRRARRWWLAVMMLAMTCSAAAQDSVAAARDLYGAAAYEGALAMLDRLRKAPSVADQPQIEQYRAFCFIALGRTAEAELAIGTVVRERPLYLPSESEVSPRVRTAFRDVRRKLLPEIAQARYAEAKEAFDQKSYAAAQSAFTRVLDLLDDPDARRMPASIDLSTLASGFLYLANAALQPVVPVPPPAPPPASPPGPPPLSAAARRDVFVNTDAGVTPPEPITERFPPLPDALKPFTLPFRGLLDLLIGPTGEVESVTLVKSVHPLYDPQLLAAAKAWRYGPAMKDGRPVKYLRTLEIVLSDR